MKVCIYGAGAIGGYLAVALDEAGCDVSVVARRANLAAIKEHGITLHIGGETKKAYPRVTDEPADLGPQDYVIIALKANAVPGVADRIATLFHDDTAVVTTVNGIPWWYFHGVEGELANTRLESVDPGGVQWSTLNPARAIGCVVYPACDLVEPGVVQHIEGNRFSLGEPTGEKTDRVVRLSEALRAGGLKAPVRPRIRDEIWVKLWGNLSFNPISALTGSTLDTICRTPDVRAVARAMMEEAQAVGEHLGVRFSVGIDKRLAGAEQVGAHKTSMLQDLERGRPLELDALVTSVQELGRMTGTPTPTIDTVLALTKLRAAEAGC